MADLTVSADVDTMMASANNAAIRSNTGADDAANLSTGVLADARVQESNVTQHEGALDPSGMDSGVASLGQVPVADGASGISWATPVVGDVDGPGSSTDDNITTFDGATGKLIQDSGISISALQTQTAGNSARTDLMDPGVTASTTQTQGQAAQTDQIVNVTTVANDNDVITLASAAEGFRQTVYNNGANILQVFPASGDDLGEGTNASTTIESGQFGVFTASDATNWITVISRAENGKTIHSIAATLTREQMSNGHTNFVTAAVTLTLLAADVNTSFNVKTIGDVEVTVDPDDDDLIYLDGIALDDGDKIVNASTAGDVAAIEYYNATGMYASTNAWTDGGA